MFPMKYLLKILFRKTKFDVRREKNLEFLVNEVSVREIVGKF